MEITLEKIDVIRERTGLSYAEAREILRTYDGDLVEALVQIEESARTDQSDQKHIAKDVVDKVKDMFAKGSETTMKVTRDGKTLVELPLTAGVLGSLIAPQLALVGAVAALATRCPIKLEENAFNNESTNEQSENESKDIFSEGSEHSNMPS